MRKKNKILVTGGAGFIGSNFIHCIMASDLDVDIVCVDKLSYAGNLVNLDSVMNKGNFKFVHASITDKEIMDKLFITEKFDYVVNFAAESHVDRSIISAERFLHSNILGVGVLLDCCVKYGIKRFHQVSTDEVYGDLPLEEINVKFVEDSHIRTSSPYAASKAAADMLVLAYKRTYNLPITISRCSNNYGPFHHPEKLIPKIITKAILDEKVPVYGTGENVRDWIYVCDHCRAIIKILFEGKEGEIYNVGSNNERTNIYVVKRVLNILGKSEELIEYTDDRLGHDLRYAIDSTKLQEELKWEAQVGFEEGLEKTVKWYLDNQYWWKELCLD